jgi:hypothetical protein
VAEVSLWANWALGHLDQARRHEACIPDEVQFQTAMVLRVILVLPYDSLGALFDAQESQVLQSSKS